MGEAEVTVSAEEGVAVDATREEGVDVAVNMGEPNVDIAGAIPDADILALEEVEFPFDSAELTDAAMANIRNAVEVLEEGRTALLTGFASPIGDTEYNLELSRQRVENVRQAMVDAGADPNQIVTQAAGENDAETSVAEDGTVPRTEENRRVEIRIVPDEVYEAASRQG